MSCSCHKRTENPTELIYPDEPCISCCEKHFSQAWDWATEGGYVPVNRQKIIGALASAQAHCWQNHYGLAEMLRDLRHKIQDRREIGNREWTRIAKEIEHIIEEDAKHQQERGA